jgi:hypothetical protein
MNMYSSRMDSTCVLVFMSPCIPAYLYSYTPTFLYPYIPTFLMTNLRKKLPFHTHRLPYTQ